MPFTRGILVAIAVAGLILLPHNGRCGPVFDRVMQSGTFRLGLPYNLIPQGFLSPNGEWVGFEVDLGAELARHMNLKLEKVKVTDNTWGPMLSAGRIDAAMCRIKQTRAREGEFDFSVAYFFDTRKILIVKGAFSRAQDLTGHKIAAVQGSSSEKEGIKLLRAGGDQSAEQNVVSYPDRPSCFMALGQEKVAGWIDSGLTLLEYASRNPGRFELIDASDIVEPVAVAVPQNDSAWRDLINFSIQDVAADGSLKKVYDKWFGPEMQYAFPSKRGVEIWPQ